MTRHSFKVLFLAGSCLYTGLSLASTPTYPFTVTLTSPTSPAHFATDGTLVLTYHVVNNVGPLRIEGAQFTTPSPSTLYTAAIDDSACTYNGQSGLGQGASCDVTVTLTGGPSSGLAQNQYLTLLTTLQAGSPAPGITIAVGGGNTPSVCGLSSPNNPTINLAAYKATIAPIVAHMSLAQKIGHLWWKL